VHPSLIGTVPGVILQANYIESLLTGRVFSPVPTRVQIVMGAIWLLFIVWVSWRFESSPGLALAFSVLAAIIPA
jgi:CHASE2 domain-containing sensor protein